MRNPLNKAVVFVMFTVLLVNVQPLVFPAGFSLGDTVEVCNTGGSGLIVRDAPAGNDVGVKYDGDRGMILAGPQTASLGEVDYTWWKVRWGEDAHQGWSAEGYPGGVDYLGKVTVSPSAKFSMGDFVKVHGSGPSGLAIRTDPPALLWQSSAAENVAGKIVGGPFYGVANGMPGFCSFWKVDYGIDLGWSAEDYLIETTVPRMSVNPSSIVNESIVPGDLITLEVNVTGIPQDPGTCAIQFRLEWDSTVLNGVTITTPTGHFMDPDGTAWAEGNLWIMARRIGIGYADYAVTFYDLSLAIAHGYAPRYGSGVLVRLTLRVMSVGSTAITLKETIVGDRDANPVFHSAENGYFRNKPGSIADSFRFPLDGPWTISRRFGNYFPEWTGYHLGEDVLRSFEAPVYAPADGVVKHNSKKSYYGYVVIIEHQLEDETYVCSVLGHLREAGRIAVGTKVTKGQRIGYLSSIPGDNGEIIHLHYGVRKGEYSEELDPDGQWRYRGYGPIDIVGSWYSPSAFINNYNVDFKAPPSYNLTVSIDGNGTTIPAPGTYTLNANTTLSLVGFSDGFQEWCGTDSDYFSYETLGVSKRATISSSSLSDPAQGPLSETKSESKVTMNYHRAVVAIFGFPISRLFMWPVPSVDYRVLIQDYAARNILAANKYHTGMDIGNVANSPVVATYDGIVAEVLREGDDPNSPHNHNMENVVILKHVLPGGRIVFSLYADLALNSIPENLQEGQFVTQGTQLGATGVLLYDGRWINSVHFEIKDKAVLENPRKYPKDSTDTLYGYTPYRPENYGYRDPVAFLHQTFEYVHPNAVRAITDTVKVRRGPHIEYPYLTDLQDTELPPLDPSWTFIAFGSSRGTDGEWYHIGSLNHLGDSEEGWVPKNCLETVPWWFLLSSPGDLMVSDPDGVTITKGAGEVSGMSYIECDTDMDGELDDVVTMSQMKTGNYLVAVLPEPEASPSSTYTLEVLNGNMSILLADDTKISEVPADPYIINRNESSIMLRNINTAVTDMTLSRNVVGKGYSLFVNTTVQNQGNLDETFNATVYTNETTLATFTDIALTSGSSTTLALAWNTTGLAYGNYSISAYAPPVEGEIYTVDNILAEDWVLVTIPGDINGDRRVNILDAIKIANSFNSKLGDANWNPNADINGDDKVNILDAIKLANHFNEYWT